MVRESPFDLQYNPLSDNAENIRQAHKLAARVYENEPDLSSEAANGYYYPARLRVHITDNQHIKEEPNSRLPAINLHGVSPDKVKGYVYHKLHDLMGRKILSRGEGEVSSFNNSGYVIDPSSEYDLLTGIHRNSLPEFINSNQGLLPLHDKSSLEDLAGNIWQHLAKSYHDYRYDNPEYTGNIRHFLNNHYSPESKYRLAGAKLLRRIAAAKGNPHGLEGLNKQDNILQDLNNDITFSGGLFNEGEYPEAKATYNLRRLLTGIGSSYRNHIGTPLHNFIRGPYKSQIPLSPAANKALDRIHDYLFVR